MAIISIIIPAHNAQSSIGTCLQSIFNQTFTDCQIIVVNDGSTDQTAEVLKKYQDKITLINQSNQGAAAARNAGAKLATGDYLIFCDADITMQPDMLEKMHQALQDNSDATYAYSAFIFGSKLFSLWPFDSARLKTMPYIHTTSLIKKEAFPGFDLSLKRFQDWDLWLTMLDKGLTGVFIPEVLFKVKSGGTMSTWLPKFLYHLPFLPAVRRYKAAKDIIKTKHNL